MVFLCITQIHRLLNRDLINQTPPYRQAAFPQLAQLLVVDHIHQALKKKRWLL